LDAESELVVQEALDTIVEKKRVTTIIIAHRLSTIRNADTINVITAGVRGESGTHDELLARQGYYYNLVMKQDGGETGAESSPGTTPGISRSNSEVDLGHVKDNLTESTRVSTLTSHLEFKSVVFSYPTRPKKHVLNGFSLAIEQGQTVALVGPSGGGKSTIVGLIERFYDINSGTVEYMGHDIRALNVAWYRDQIGYVGQEPVLFNETIAKNIAVSSPSQSAACASSVTHT
jgi:ATP-binding cassette, subfamily B (MDR/TAP), member 1